jgi:hypothetical protein
MPEGAEIQTTRAEKLLAVVLTAFLFLGGIWSYSKLQVDPPPYPTQPALSAADQRTLAVLEDAERTRGEAARAEQSSRAELELRRERYRTALDAGQPAGELEAAYRRADRIHGDAQQRLRVAEDDLASARPPAEAAIARRDAAAQRLAEEYDDDRRTASLQTFGLRLALLLALLGLAYLVHTRLRATRYSPVAGSLLGAVTLLALVGGFDYLGDYVEWQALGPLVLSLVGVGLTLVAFVSLQRQLARRLPARRAGKGECPTCGYPDRGSAHCEGCGTALRVTCPSCAAPRRAGAPHCGVCGA